MIIAGCQTVTGKSHKFTGTIEKSVRQAYVRRVYVRRVHVRRLHVRRIYIRQVLVQIPRCF